MDTWFEEKVLWKTTWTFHADMQLSNLTNASVHVPKHEALCAFNDSMGNIIDREQAEKHRQMLATLSAASNPLFKKTNAQTPQTREKIGTMLSMDRQTTLLIVPD